MNELNEGVWLDIIVKVWHHSEDQSWLALKAEQFADTSVALYTELSLSESQLSDESSVKLIPSLSGLRI